MSAKPVKTVDRAVSRAKREAHKILDRFGHSIPVDVESIVRAHNLKIKAEALEESVSGMLVIKDDGGVVAVNESHHRNRRRFTIAHELGHFVLHGNSARVFIDAGPVFYRDEAAADGTRIQEIQANTFAAELLMPESAVVDIFRKQPLDPHDEAAVRRMAARFEVSAQALTLRLINLGLVVA